MQRWLRQYRQEVKGTTTPAARAITPDEVIKILQPFINMHIEPLYNQRRQHFTLGNLSPAEYELKQQQNLLARVADC